MGWIPEKDGWRAGFSRSGGTAWARVGVGSGGSGGQLLRKNSGVRRTPKG